MELCIIKVNMGNCLSEIGKKTLNDLLKSLFETQSNEISQDLFGDDKISWKLRSALRIYVNSSNSLSANLNEISNNYDECQFGNTEEISEDFDLVLCDAPNYTDNITIRQLNSCFKKLSQDGICISILKNVDQLKRLSASNYFKRKGIHPGSVIKLPDEFWSQTPWGTILVIFLKSDELRQVCFARLVVSDIESNIDFLVGRHRGNYLGPPFEKFISFVEEFGEREIPNLIQLAREMHLTGESLSTGILDGITIFPGFEIWEIVELSSGATEFSYYEKFRLSDLLLSIDGAKTVKKSQKTWYIFPKNIISST
tara:strand:- start:125 stop:1060 length:936 start_codon:yes stop_codon:yes gene_type:complete